MKDLFDFMADMSRESGKEFTEWVDKMEEGAKECEACGEYDETKDAYGPDLCPECHNEARIWLQYVKEADEGELPLTDLPSHVAERLLKENT